MTDSFWYQAATLMESRLDTLCLKASVWGEPRAILGGTLASVVGSVAEQATGRHQRQFITTEQGTAIDIDQIRGLYRRPDFPNA